MLEAVVQSPWASPRFADRSAIHPRYARSCPQGRRGYHRARPTERAPQNSRRHGQDAEARRISFPAESQRSLRAAKVGPVLLGVQEVQTDARGDGQAASSGGGREPSIVDAVATSLRYEGFDVDEAATGRAALAQAQNAPPDMIVLDIMLPDLDGLGVTRRRGQTACALPILFLTARDTVDNKVAGLTLGGDDYVTKPFSLAEIVARTHAILRRTSGQARK